MIKNNLIVAWRNILRNKLNTTINLIGLAIGISGCLVIYQLAAFEYGINKDIVDEDRIYRLYTEYSGDFTGFNAGVPTGVNEVAKNNLHDAAVKTMLHTYRATVEIPDESNANIKKKMGTQDDLVIVEPEYFDLIQNYEWLAGSAHHALREPAKVVITESKAKQYFGVKNPTDAIGRIIYYGDSVVTSVAGILKDPDFQSDFHFTDFISVSTILNSNLKKQVSLNAWGGVRSADQLFLKIADGSSLAQVQAQLGVIQARADEESKGSTVQSNFKLQPLSDLHFNAALGSFDQGRGTAHQPTLWILMGIAAFLLLIAAINFINLATVQATRRAKEVGIRKVIGEHAVLYAPQFLVETFLITLLAIPVAILLSEAAFQYFAELLPIGLALKVWSLPVLSFLILSVLAVTFLAGLYPSFYLSAQSPTYALNSQKTVNTISGRSVSLRKGLIAFQFVLAQVFIITTLIVGKQVNFMLKEDLGFNQDKVIYFYTGTRDYTKKRLVQNRLEQLPQVSSTALQNKPPVNQGYQTNIITFQKADTELKSEVHIRFVDTAYLQHYEIPLIAGRNLLPSDTSTEVLINETYVHSLGFEDAEEVLGKEVQFNNRTVPIVGVVKDFYLRSMHHEIPPAALTNHVNGAYCISARIKSNASFNSSLDNFKVIWTDVFPKKDFHYYFLDESIAKMYETEVHASKLINTATILAILISCLGLFGLSFFTITQRAKEISIRKILGASMTSLLSMLSKEFLWLVIIALLIAVPIVWFATGKWLSNFAYQANIGWGIYLLGGLTAILIALLTISFQSVKATLANPVEALRND